MTGVALLQSVLALHRIGMTVPRALEHEAASRNGVSHALASRWRAIRVRTGDPVGAVRQLCLEAGDRRDRFALEALRLCLESPEADHERMLSVAADYLDRERAGITSVAGAGAVIAALSMAAPLAVWAVRLLMAV
ncbi:MAG: hypothetical protein ACTHOG_12525 [Marmoricola sp.]